MTNRVLDIAREPARLSIRNGLLVVESGGEERDAVPCDEIAAVVVSHRQVTFTQAVLSELAKAGGALVSCDEKSMPKAMMLPLEGHHAQAERFRKQAAMGQPARKRLWQSVVRSKIRAQATVLEEATGSDKGLRALAGRVRSGDPDNVEARSARRYWTELFGEEGRFARGNEEDVRNHLLNYGYAVLRAASARAICGAGLHPTFSLYHRSAQNAFALADDLMEPYRPAVDRVVRRQEAGRGLDAEAKRALIGAVTGRLKVEGEERTVTEILTRVSQSLARVVQGEGKSLWLPEWEPAEEA